MKPQHQLGAVSLIRILVIAGMLALVPASQADIETETAQAEPPSVMPMFDADGDGWDDMWVSIYPELNHRDKTKDTDGDGITDYDEMLRGTNPLIANEPVVPPTPEELAEMERNAKIAEKERKEAFAHRKAELAKFAVKPRRGADGQPISGEAIKTEKLKRAGFAAARRIQANEVRKGRVAAFKNKSEIARATKTADGRTIMLIDSREGEAPRFYTTHNAVSADTISTDEVRAGGSLGLSLDGTGMVIGMWDGSDVRLTHQEFATGGQRVVDMDGVTSVSYHASHVAATLMGKGVNSAAIGMSPNANLDAYDFDNDLAEIATASLNDEMRVSNHSYGLLLGWEYVEVTQGNFYWLWFGDTLVSQTEDYRFGYYDTNARNIDEITYLAPWYLPVWSAGNDRAGDPRGPASQPIVHYAWNSSQEAFILSTTVRPLDGGAAGYDLLGSYGVAKNNLTVAAVDDIVGGYSSVSGVQVAVFSSFGGPDDGRIKPDLCANGVDLVSAWYTGDAQYMGRSGTSMAAPSVSGSLNLLVQHYKNLFDTLDGFRASTLKAIAIHAADEAGASPGPDYAYGWGLMNTKRAAELISAHHNTRTALTYVKEITLNNGDYVEFPVKASGSGALKATLCWTDPAGSVPAQAVNVNVAALVNDLDLRLVGPSTTHYPWKLNRSSPTSAATNSGDNDRDTVEQVLVASPTANDEYVVRVTHKGTMVDETGAPAPQTISLVLSGIVEEPEPEFAVPEVVQTDETEFTLTWNSVVGATYVIMTSTDLDTWTEAVDGNSVPFGEISATKTTTAVPVPMGSAEEKRFWRIKRIIL